MPVPVTLRLFAIRIFAPIAPHAGTYIASPQASSTHCVAVSTGAGALNSGTSTPRSVTE